MRPIYKIEADGKDVTANFLSRLISLTCTDESGFDSDELTITVDNSGTRLKPPKKGVVLTVYLGYEETNLLKIGEYIVDEPEFAGPPDLVIIRGRAADLRNQLKSGKSRSWSNKTIGDIVKVIASEHGMKPRVSDVLSGILIPHIDQTSESDLNFITRLAQDYDAIAKPAAKNLIFTPRYQSKSVSGIDLPQILISKSNAINYRLTLADRTSIGHVVAYFQDKAKVRRTGITVGDPALAGKRLKRTYATEQEARKAAESALADFKRGKRELSLTLEGDPAIKAECPLVLNGWPEPFDDKYVVNYVEHRMDEGGYTTVLNAN